MSSPTVSRPPTTNIQRSIVSVVLWRYYPQETSSHALIVDQCVWTPSLLLNKCLKLDAPQPNSALYFYSTVPMCVCAELNVLQVEFSP